MRPFKSQVLLALFLFTAPAQADPVSLGDEFSALREKTCAQLCPEKQISLSRSNRALLDEMQVICLEHRQKYQCAKLEKEFGLQAIQSCDADKLCAGSTAEAGPCVIKGVSMAANVLWGIAKTPVSLAQMGLWIAEAGKKCAQNEGKKLATIEDFNILVKDPKFHVPPEMQKAMLDWSCGRVETLLEERMSRYREAIRQQAAEHKISGPLPVTGTTGLIEDYKNLDIRALWEQMQESPLFNCLTPKVQVELKCSAVGAAIGLGAGVYGVKAMLPAMMESVSNDGKVFLESLEKQLVQKRTREEILAAATTTTLATSAPSELFNLNVQTNGKSHTPSAWLSRLPKKEDVPNEPMVDDFDSNVTLDGEPLRKLQRHGQTWQSNYATEPNAQEFDPRAMIHALGPDAAEHFGSKMLSDREMLAPTPSALNKALDKGNALLEKFGRSDRLTIRFLTPDKSYVGDRDFVTAFVDGKVYIARNGSLYKHDLAAHSLSFLIPEKYFKLAQAQAKAIVDYEKYVQTHYPEMAKLKEVRDFFEALYHEQAQRIDLGTGNFGLDLAQGGKGAGAMLELTAEGKSPVFNVEEAFHHFIQDGGEGSNLPQETKSKLYEAFKSSYGKNYDQHQYWRVDTKDWDRIGAEVGARVDSVQDVLINQENRTVARTPSTPSPSAGIIDRAAGDNITRVTSREALQAPAKSITQEEHQATVSGNGLQFHAPPFSEGFKAGDKISKVSVPLPQSARRPFPDGGIYTTDKYLNETAQRDLAKDLKEKGYRPIDPEFNFKPGNQKAADVELPDVLGREVIGMYRGSNNSTVMVSGRVIRTFTVEQNGYYTGAYVVVDTPTGEVTLFLNDRANGYTFQNAKSTLWMRQAVPK